MRKPLPRSVGEAAFAPLNQQLVYFIQLIDALIIALIHRIADLMRQNAVQKGALFLRQATDKLSFPLIRFAD